MLMYCTLRSQSYETIHEWMNGLLPYCTVPSSLVKNVVCFVWRQYILSFCVNPMHFVWHFCKMYMLGIDASTRVPYVLPTATVAPLP